MKKITDKQLEEWAKAAREMADHVKLIAGDEYQSEDHESENRILKLIKALRAECEMLDKAITLLDSEDYGGCGCCENRKTKVLYRKIEKFLKENHG